MSAGAEARASWGRHDSERRDPSPLRGPWTAVLDALEAEADRLAAVAGDPVAVELVLRDGVGARPTAPGPLPRDLAARARAVLARLHAAEAALREGRDAVACALAARPATPPPTPRYIDRSF